MVSSHPNNEKSRKEKTIKAHNVLLRFDEQDISGQVTFHFKKGEGIVGHEVREIMRWNTHTVNANDVKVFQAGESSSGK